jgi:hypothetical protein
MSQMTGLVTIGGLVVAAFVSGTLLGATWVEQVRDARSRRQAARQRDLNDQARALRAQWELLRERQESSEEDMRWRAKRQAGFVVIEYEED